MECHGWVRSETGPARDINQDRYLVRPDAGVFAVADGIGGKRKGEEASERVIAYLDEQADRLAQLARESDPALDEEHRSRVLEQLKQTLQYANAELFKRGDGAMGTTVDVLIVAEGTGFVAHVGDSRVYMMRRDHIVQLTDDHTFAETLRRQRREAPIEEEELDVAHLEHVLTRCLGDQPRVDIDTLYIDVQIDDRFVLCSDGLSDALTEMDLLEVTRNREGGQAARELVREARRAGLEDNVTAVVADISRREPTDEHDTTVDTFRKISFLEQIDLFANLDAQQLVKVLQIVYRRTYQEGDYILERGEPGERLFMIVEGAVDIRMEDREVTRLEPGEHFGELALIEGRERSADVIALETSLLLVVPSTQFWDLASRRDLELGHQLLRNLLVHATRRLRETTERMMLE